jgi:hypothetical protein
VIEGGVGCLPGMGMGMSWPGWSGWPALHFKLPMLHRLRVRCVELHGLSACVCALHVTACAPLPVCRWAATGLTQRCTAIHACMQNTAGQLRTHLLPGLQLMHVQSCVKTGTQPTWHEHVAQPTLHEQCPHGHIRCTCTLWAVPRTCVHTTPRPVQVVVGHQHVPARGEPRLHLVLLRR